MSNNQISTVDFYGHPLTVITTPSQKLVAMKPICEGIGLQWEAQLKRIKRHPIMLEGMSIMDTPSAGGTQAMVCLPLSMLNGWLFGVESSRVRPEIRDTLLMYQRECFAVLAAYWQEGEAINPRKRQPKALPNGLTVEQQGAIKQLVKARVEALPHDKRAKAAVTLWSALKSRFGCTYKKIEPELYSDAVSLVARVELDGEWMPPEEAQPDRLPIHHPIDSLLVGRRRGMVQPRNADTRLLNVALSDLREFQSSPCEQVLHALAEAGYEVEGAWWELRTYRNKLAYLLPLIENLSNVAAEPQQYVISRR